MTAQVGCRPGRKLPESVTILAAASTTEAVEAIAEQFSSTHPEYDLRISSGPSNGLAQQIIAGALADLFLSANEQWMQAIADRGLVSRTIDLLSNHMVLIVPSENPAGVLSPADLLSSQVRHVALAGEKVPAGIYAEQALAALGLLESLQKTDKLVRGSDVRAALVYVERAEADAGIVYATDAVDSHRVKVITEFDPTTYDAVYYPLALLTPGADNPGARQCFEFFQSATARDVFLRHGFRWIEAASTLKEQQ